VSFGDFNARNPASGMADNGFPPRIGWLPCLPAMVHDERGRRSFANAWNPARSKSPSIIQLYVLAGDHFNNERLRPSTATRAGEPSGRLACIEHGAARVTWETSATGVRLVRWHDRAHATSPGSTVYTELLRLNMSPGNSHHVVKRSNSCGTAE
jgi:hypothetical protein